MSGTGRRVAGVRVATHGWLVILLALAAGVSATPRAAASQKEQNAQFYRLLTPAEVPASAAPNAWRVETTPNPAKQPNGTLLSVSCVTMSDCIGVGSSYNGAGITLPLAERWNGTSWAKQITPSPAGAAWSRLFGVSCLAPTDCVATGYYVSAAGHPLPLAEQWNGTSWTRQTTPSPAGARASGLFALSCRSPQACTAVGEYNNSHGTPLTLAERWNGTRWQIQATPNPARAQATGLFGVSCPVSRACTATGSFINASGTMMTLAMAWHGQGWAIQATPGAAGAASAQLLAVSCTAPDACTASGNSTDSTGASAGLAERWNGTTWELQTVPTPTGATGGKLTAIVCTGPLACTAAGSATESGQNQPLAEAWNGTQWAIQATPSPASSAGGGFSGLSCGAAYCSAVGSYAPGTGQANVPLAEAWNGTTWTIQQVPSRNGAVFSEFATVSCPSAQACTAIGASATAPSRIVPLAEQWNGKRWHIQTIPGPTGAIISMLSGLSCAKPDSCVAAGSYITATGAALALAEAWNGTTWTTQAVPLPAGATGGQLVAVSCPAKQACTAVGSYTKSSGPPHPLAERWNGTTWQSQALATLTGVTAPQLTGVSCPAAQTCTAVGSATRKGQTQPLAEAWNGTTWTAQAVPLPAGVAAGHLLAVSCPATQACTATGGDSSGTSPVLAEQWNGSTWTAQTAPTPPGYTGPLGAPALSSVSCVPGHGCTATGNYTRNNQPAYFIEAWNGTHWSLQTAPTPPGTTSGALGAVSCSQAVCTAAGGYTGLTGVAVTLALTTATFSR